MSALPRAGWLDMGASSSKRAFFWQKKKSPVERAWGRLKGALSNKKSKRKRLLEKLKPGNLKDKKLKKRSSLTDKKEPEFCKRFSLGNIKKGTRESGSKKEESKSKCKDEKTLKNREAPFHQKVSWQKDVKKTDKSQSKRTKIAWMSK